MARLYSQILQARQEGQRILPINGGAHGQTQRIGVQLVDAVGAVDEGSGFVLSMVVDSEQYYRNCR